MSLEDIHTRWYRVTIVCILVEVFGDIAHFGRIAHQGIAHQAVAVFPYFLRLDSDTKLPDRHVLTTDEPY